MLIIRIGYSWRILFHVGILAKFEWFIGTFCLIFDCFYGIFGRIDSQS